MPETPKSLKSLLTLACAVPLLIAGAAANAAAPEAAAPAHLRVAFVISEGFNVIDFAGPWEVFQDVMLPPSSTGADAQSQMPIDLYTVARSQGEVTSTGGATVLPRYTFANAPRPDIVVIGAQSDNSPALLDWLRRQHAAGVTVVSICTGARKLALAGLLDGRPATSHHDFLDGFRQQFPAVKWESSRRFVRAGERLYTAGGLTSGIDLALHLVDQRFGTAVAQATADYMEYRGDGWKQAE